MKSLFSTKGRYEAPCIENLELLLQEVVLGGASNYTEKPVDWDEYWGDGND